jgi:hypothetical protein
VGLLKAYPAVLVFCATPWKDQADLGDNLAQYFEEGGNFVLAVLSQSTVDDALLVGGDWATKEYFIITPNKFTFNNEDGDLVIPEADANSPLLRDVTSLTAAEAFTICCNPVNSSKGDVVVASWGSPQPLIVRGERFNGRKMVALNFYPPLSRISDAYWKGSGAEIMRNALLYS